jgi:hypothetical protein
VFAFRDSCPGNQFEHYQISLAGMGQNQPGDKTELQCGWNEDRLPGVAQVEFQVN